MKAFPNLFASERPCIFSNARATVPFRIIGAIAMAYSAFGFTWAMTYFRSSVAECNIPLQGLNDTNKLGKPFTETVYEFQDLNRTYVFNLCFILMDNGARNPLSKQYEWIITDGQAKELVWGALEVDDETPLPTGHIHDRYEGSLTLVLIQRYVAKGRKLSKLTPELLKKGYGDFSLNSDKTEILYKKQSGTPIEVTYTKEQLAKASDWKITNPFDIKKARFHSAELDEGLGLKKRFEDKYGSDFFPDLAAPIVGYEGAADSLKNEIEKTKRSIDVMPNMVQ